MKLDVLQIFHNFIYTFSIVVYYCKSFSKYPRLDSTRLDDLNISISKSSVFNAGIRIFSEPLCVHYAAKKGKLSLLYMHNLARTVRRDAYATDRKKAGELCVISAR